MFAYSFNFLLTSCKSLAQALYFASRGEGILRQDDVEAPYKSPARVILSGLGADELLGGYIRHKNAYKHGGWQALLDEVYSSYFYDHKRTHFLYSCN